MSKHLLTGAPIDIHCHGIGGFDFTEIGNIDLEEIDTLLASQGIYCIPTLYLRKRNLESLIDKLEQLEQLKTQGKLTHILGFAIEGPLLSSAGGTPQETIWTPTTRDWERLAKFSDGLCYVVVSPDYPVERHVIAMLDVLVPAGVIPALGHFMKNDPQKSADSILRVVDATHQRSTKSGPKLITDHLMNDMPSKIRYAWRSNITVSQYECELKKLNVDQWSLDNMENQIGIVPATLAKLANDESLVGCLNFDGKHVDLKICASLVKVIGSKNLIAMTDRIEGKRLANRALIEKNDLLYQGTKFDLQAQ